MTEIIDFKSKGAQPKKSAKRRKTEPSPNNIMKELRKKFPKNEEFDPEHKALDELIKLAVEKKLDKGETSTRFDAILALIQEEGLKLSRLSASDTSRDEMADIVEDIGDLIMWLGVELSSEVKYPSKSFGAA